MEHGRDFLSDEYFFYSSFYQVNDFKSNPEYDEGSEYFWDIRDKLSTQLGEEICEDFYNFLAHVSCVNS